MKAWTVVGYTYAAENFHETPLAERLVAEGHLHHSVLDPGGDLEEALDLWANDAGIDRHDESMFDSDEFPKTILASDVDCLACLDDGCRTCGRFTGETEGQ